MQVASIANRTLITSKKLPRQNLLNECVMIFVYCFFLRSSAILAHHRVGRDARALLELLMEKHRVSLMRPSDSLDIFEPKVEVKCSRRENSSKSTATHPGSCPAATVRSHPIITHLTGMRRHMPAVRVGVRSESKGGFEVAAVQCYAELVCEHVFYTTGCGERVQNGTGRSLMGKSRNLLPAQGRVFRIEFVRRLP